MKEREVQLSTRQIGDVSSALGQFEHAVAELAKAQRRLAEEEPNDERRSQIERLAASNAAVSEEIAGTRALFARPTRVTVRFYE